MRFEAHEGPGAQEKYQTGHSEEDQPGDGVLESAVVADILEAPDHMAERIGVNDRS